MQVVPLQPLQSQTLQCQLNGQACTLNIYQLAYGLFFDLYVGGTVVQTGVICWNANLIVRSAYLGFQGDFCFVDTQGVTDPVYTGLGSRYQLLYLSPADIAALDLPVGVE